VVADSHRFVKEQDPNPHLGEMLDLDLRSSEKVDPDPR
jgi:hypothetical protein